MKWLHLGVPARQAPLGASLRPAAALAQRDSPHPQDSQLEERLGSQLQALPGLQPGKLRAEMFVVAEEIARAKSTQARVSIGRH